MRHSHVEVAPAVWRALQAYVRAIPSSSLSWYVAPEGGFLPLDAPRWEQVREEMLEQPCPVSCSVSLQQSRDEVGGYNFEYVGRRLDAPPFARDENSTSAVSFTVPTEYLMEKGADSVRALAIDLVRELPISFGYASLALVAPNEWWFAARQEVRQLRDRYPGLDVCILEQSSRVLGTRARGTYWLTFIGQPLLGQLGGTEHLQRRFATADPTLQALGNERLLLTCGAEPRAFDTQREPPPPQFLALARWLEPFLYHEELTSWFSPHDPEDMRRWVRRFYP